MRSCYLTHKKKTQKLCKAKKITCVLPANACCTVYVNCNKPVDKQQ